jgi:hypothetical protein
MKPPETSGDSPFRPVVRPAPAVGLSADLRRIQRLPARAWEERFADPALVEGATEELRRPAGTMKLRPIQAAALVELSELGGLLAPIGCGEGKTLISALAHVALGVPRSVLLVPGSLVEKTRRDFVALAEHWDFDPSAVEVVSYQKLGRVSAATLLDDAAPPLLIADEAHYLKSPRAARTKRVMRYLEEHPETHFAAMSGTITSRSLDDYAHLAEAALGANGTPLPTVRRVLLEWANAVDEWSPAKEATTVRLVPGALRHLYDPRADELHDDGDTLAAARRAVRRRVDSTPGVVTSHDGRPGASLVVRASTCKYPDEIDEMFREMRANWALPGGLAHRVEIAPGVEVTDTFIGPMDLWRHARELALFGVYRWKEPGPRPWMEARAEWSKVVRGCASTRLSPSSKRSPGASWTG